MSEAAPASAPPLVPVRPVLGVASARNAIIALTLAGFALRLQMARGPLWVDEIWSIENLHPINHFWSVFYAISHDNNHVFNSVWLFLALPLSDDPVWLRLPALVAGALAIPAMARLGARAGPAGAVAAAGLTAFSFFFVSYSAEARGYGPAILAAIVAYDALERALDAPDSRWRFVLAAALGVGLFWHLAIGVAAILLASVALIENSRRYMDLSAAVKVSAHILWPSVLAAVPAAACLAAGYVATGGFTIGASRPFETVAALGGQAQTVMTTLGVPATPLALAVVLFAGPPLIVAAILFAASPERRVVYGVTLLALPAAVLLLHPPNSHIPRYYFLCAIFLVLLAAESFAALWRRGGAARVAAAAALILAAAGGLAQFAVFQATQYPAWPEALAAIRAEGGRSVGTNFAFNVGREVRYFNRRQTTPLALIPDDQFCATPPDAYILDLEHAAATPVLDLGGSACRLRYAYVRTYGAPGLSQTPWAIYRRAAP